MPQLSHIGLYKRLFFTAVLVLGLDLLTKYLVISFIPENTYLYPIPVIDNFLYWVHIHNAGAAWGILQNQSHYLAVLAVVVVIAIFYFREYLELHRHSIQYAIGGLVGGTLGNLFDRLYHGHVIDFIDVHLPGYRYPSFNIADMGISIGVTIYFLIILRDSFIKGPKEG